MVHEGEVFYLIPEAQDYGGNTGQAVDRPLLYPPKATKFQAQMKVKLEDWQVTEEFDAGFTGEGEHGYFFIEKRCYTARSPGWRSSLMCPAGRWLRWHERQTRSTRQWFSVRRPALKNRQICQGLSAPRVTTSKFWLTNATSVSCAGESITNRFKFAKSRRSLSTPQP